MHSAAGTSTTSAALHWFRVIFIVFSALTLQYIA